MSYNIDTWKTKKLEGLVIPLKELYTYEREDFHPSQPIIVNAETNEVLLHCEDGHIKAHLKKGNLHVTEISITGEGSGTFMHEVLEPALNHSTGLLEAVLVWEGGDSITRLVVDQGIVTQNDVEL